MLLSSKRFAAFARFAPQHYRSVIRSDCFSRRAFSSSVTEGPQISNGGDNVDAVWQKVANILVAVTEKQLSKVLHVYPDSGFTKHLAENRTFDMEGLAGPDVQHAEDEPLPAMYNELHRMGHRITRSTQIDLRPNCFHAVVQCLPCRAQAPAGAAATEEEQGEEGLALPELIRVLASGGHLILGALAPAFERIGFREELLQLSEKGCASPYRGKLMTVQGIRLPADAFPDPAAPGKGMQYKIAVFRKE